MKLNLDCIRDILLYVEKSSPKQKIKIKYLAKDLSAYGHEQIEYCCKALRDASLITTFSKTDNFGRITGLTLKGQDFLDKIRDKTFFGKVKIFFSKNESVSLLQLIDIVINALGMIFPV